MLAKKLVIKIPKNIKVLYFIQQNLLLLIGPLGQKLLKLKLKLFLTNDYIFVTRISIKNVLNNRKIKMKPIRGITVAVIKQSLIEISILLNKKMKLIGIGYKVLSINRHKKNLLEFKLGFSHSMYFQIPSTLRIFSSKSTLIYIFGNSYSMVTQIASTIQSYKKPEPYKGKGVLYRDQNIALKAGKKI